MNCMNRCWKVMWGRRVLTMWLVLVVMLGFIGGIPGAGTVRAAGDLTLANAQAAGKKLSAGEFHSLALKSDGTVVAWGYNSNGQTDMPPGLTGVVAVAAGGYHSLALKSDGTVVAWGDNGYGQTDVPPGLTGVVAVAAGGFHSLALKSDGTVVAWGYNGYGQTDVPPGLNLFDFRLRDLTVSPDLLSPGFYADQLDYTVQAGYGVTDLSVAARLMETVFARLTVGGEAAGIGEAKTFALAVGTTTIPVVVTDLFGTPMTTYTLSVTRSSSSNADLSGLSLSAGTLSPSFSAATTAYTVNVGNAVESVEVTAALPEGSQANVTIGGTSAASGVPVRVPLTVGENAIPITVTAQDGTTTKTYTVTVTRSSSSNADLSGLSLSAGALSPAFSATTTAYTVDVGNEVDHVDVTAVVADIAAALKVNGKPAASGIPVSVDLTAGDNVIGIDVMAQDGTTKRYVITVTRAQSTGGSGGGGGSAPVLLRLVAVPEFLGLNVGQTGAVQAYAEYAGGWKQDVTGLATYQSADSAVAEVDSRGRVTGKSPGTAEIGVSYQGQTVRVKVTVKDVTPPEPDFTDIKGHWAENLIREAAARGWVSGFPDGTFRPDEPVTRGEFAVMAMKAFGWTAPEDQQPHYLDRDAIPDWARDAVAAGTALGVLKGYDDGYFRPDRLISRAELGVIIAKAAGLPVMAGARTSFADDIAIPEWAKRFVAADQQAGLMHGRGENRFEPAGITTRAEAVAVLLGGRTAGGTSSAP